MSESKSLLARLLAKENITVQHGNYSTAFFDVQNRILGLPLWKDDDKHLYDMLVGHEVGHALYTPAEGWMDMQSAAGDNKIPVDYLNIVEDIRIERLIQETYPGIVRAFKKGYSHLSERDFFGIGDRDINTMSLMDRINIKAKLRDLVRIDFTSIEQPLVDAAFRANTWDEVVAAARALYEYMLDNQQDVDNNVTVSGTPSEEEHSNDQENCGSDQATMPSDNHGSSDVVNQSSDSENTSENEQEGGNGQGTDQVETYQNALNNQQDLLERNEDGSFPHVCYGLSREQLNHILVPFEKVRDARTEILDKYYDQIKAAQQKYKNYDDQWRHDMMEKISTETEYRDFMTETKQIVNVMVKEFELRKAAYQYSRSSTSKSGALNMDKLHEYKTNDDIFRRVTTLADTKSHGMVMLIDNSASMSNIRGSVISQVLVLAMFCKRVNIPFDVYSFTNGLYADEQSIDVTVQPDGIKHDRLMLTHVLSSSFSKKNYEIGYRQLFDLSIKPKFYEAFYDRMWGTPLNDILTGMHLLLKDFKSKHQIQKLIFTVLTDGDSTRLNVDVPMRTTEKLRVLLSESNSQVKVSNSYYTVRGTGQLLDAIAQEVPGTINVGYYIADSGSDFKTAVARATDTYDYSEVAAARKAVNANKFVAYDNTLGYDRYFVLRTNRNLQAKTDEFEISNNAKRAEIARVFKKYARSKKGNRVLATQFAEIIS